MKRSFSSIGISHVFALIAVMAGCTPSNKVPAGAPLMLSFSVVDPTGAPVELVTEAGPMTVPPLSHFVATFDRLLDPTALADINPDSGVPEALAGVAVIGWSGGPIDAAQGNTLYTPNGHHMFTLIYPNGPSLTITPNMGLPSASAVTVALDSGKVRSHDKKTPFEAAVDVSPTLMFDTDPLMVTVDVPAIPDPPDGGAGDDAGADDGGTGPGGAPPVDPDFVANVSFNNKTDKDLTASAIQVAGTLGGAPIAGAGLGAMVAQDEMHTELWTVSPPAGGWPAGAVVTVTVGAAAADNFMQMLGAPVTASFTVKP